MSVAKASLCQAGPALDFTTEYAYDLVGNRLSRIHTKSDNNVESTSYSYNANDQLEQEEFFENQALKKPPHTLMIPTVL